MTLTVAYLGRPLPLGNGPLGQKFFLTINKNWKTSLASLDSFGWITYDSLEFFQLFHLYKFVICSIKDID